MAMPKWERLLWLVRAEVEPVREDERQQRQALHTANAVARMFGGG